MALPEQARSAAEIALTEFCAAHSAAPAGDPTRYAIRFETNAAVIDRQRPGFLSPNEWVSVPMAKFRYSQARDEWTLFWPDADGKWQRVSNVKAEKDIHALLKVVVDDPLGVFWS